MAEEFARAKRRAAAHETTYLGQDKKVRKQGCVTWSAQPRPGSIPRPGTKEFRAHSEHAFEAATMRGLRKKVEGIQRAMNEKGWPDEKGWAYDSEHY